MYSCSHRRYLLWKSWLLSEDIIAESNNIHLDRVQYKVLGTVQNISRFHPLRLTAQKQHRKQSTGSFVAGKNWIYRLQTPTWESPSLFSVLYRSGLTHHIGVDIILIISNVNKKKCVWRKQTLLYALFYTRRIHSTHTLYIQTRLIVCGCGHETWCQRSRGVPKVSGELQ